MKTKFREYFLSVLITAVCCCIMCAILFYTRNGTTESQATPKEPTKVFDPSTVQFGPKIQWLGYAVHAIPNPTPDSDHPLVLQVEPGIQIGLRSDGMIVWRALKQEMEETGEVP